MVDVRNKFRNEDDRVINFMLNEKDSKGWSTIPMNQSLEFPDDQDGTKYNEKIIAALESSSETNSSGILSLSAENKLINIKTTNPSEMKIEQMHLSTKEKDVVSLSTEGKDVISISILMPMFYSLFALLIATKFLHLYQSQNLLGILDSQWLSQYSMAISIAFGVCGITLAYMCSQNSPTERCSKSTCGQSISMSRLTPIAMIFSAFLGFYSLGYLMMSCSFTSIDREGSECTNNFSYGMKPFAWLFMAISFYLCLYQ